MKNRLRRLFYGWRFDKAVRNVNTVANDNSPSDVANTVALALQGLPKKYAEQFLRDLEYQWRPK
jgi:hypothetical protein